MAPPPRPLALLGLLPLLAACSSDHRVSPFPQVDLGQMLRPPSDLQGQLDRAQRQAQAEGLREVRRLEGKLRGGGAFVALGFEGVDLVGRPVQATRVVTPAAIVLALGPARMASPREPSELLASLGPGGAFPSGSDLSGDNVPDVALRAPDGTLVIYRVELLGASPYPVQLRAPPTRALDVNDDGRPDLAGAPPPPQGDPIAPELLDVAVADGTTYRNDHPAALAYHRAQAQAPAAPADAPLERRLRAALERAFHAHCAGDPLAEAFQPAADLAAAHHPLPAGVASSWVRWRGWIVDGAAR